jgi:UDP-N-acetylglucosamine acyltransferase
MEGFKEIKGNLIHETAVINWDVVEIGEGNVIHPYVTIGLDALHAREKTEGIISIGDNNIFREYCSINAPTAISKKTQIGSNNFIMLYTFIAHDCVIEDNVSIANATQLGGHTYVMNNANIGYGCLIHQFQTIGSFTMLGMGTIVTKKSEIIPGNTYVGSPARCIKKNEIGLKRNNVSGEQIENEINRYYSIKKGH